MCFTDKDLKFLLNYDIKIKVSLQIKVILSFTVDAINDQLL